MKSQQKIGVLTFHRCINYGSYWQARCLLNGLRQYGHDAVLLEHVSGKVNFAEWKCALQPVLPTPTPAADRPFYALKMRKFNAAFATLPSSPCFALEEPAGMEEYDMVIVGSDEVWNLHHPWYAGYPLFFGGGVRARRLASYAASFGSYPAEKGLEERWASMLARFEQISVRDENSRAIVEAALGFRPDLVLDPCLQFPPELDQGKHEGQPYVLIYGHNFSQWFVREVRNWAQAKGYLLVSIGYRNNWADMQWLTAGPDEFAKAMTHAQAVATNFFHGCVFSLINHKPFASELTPYRSNKLRDLMATVGGEQHLMAEDTPSAGYAAVLESPADRAIVERIAALRVASNRYLDRVLC